MSTKQIVEPPEREGLKGLFLRMPEDLRLRLKRRADFETATSALGLVVPVRAVVLRYLDEGLNRDDKLSAHPKATASRDNRKRKGDTQ